jgi:hypothetical protein
MTMGAHCDHCNANDAVVVIQDYENDRFLYTCTVCEWWGFDPLRLASPPAARPSSSSQKPPHGGINSRRAVLHFDRYAISHAR